MTTLQRQRHAAASPEISKAAGVCPQSLSLIGVNLRRGGGAAEGAARAAGLRAKHLKLKQEFLGFEKQT